MTAPRYRPLSRAMRDALGKLELADEGEAYLVTCESFTESGGMTGRRSWTQAFINFRTARALEQRGLVRIDGQGEDATVYLTPEPAANDGSHAHD